MIFEQAEIFEKIKQAGRHGDEYTKHAKEVVRLAWNRAWNEIAAQKGWEECNWLRTKEEDDNEEE